MSNINSERRERYHKVAQELTFGDDTFMAAVFEYRPDIAEHIIQMLTENHELRLISSCGQYDIHSIRNRSIRKQNQKGEAEMCEIMEKLAKEYAADEKWEMRKADVLRMLNNGFDKKTIMLALGLTDAEFESLITPEAS